MLYPVSEMIKGEKYYKKATWWASAIIAILMHTSMLYLLLVLLVSGLKIKKKRLVIVSTLLSVLSPILLIVIKSILSKTTYFAKYSGSEMDVGAFSITYFVIAAVVFILAILRYEELVRKDRKNVILINACACSMIIMAYSEVLLMPYRIFPMFVPVYIIIGAKILDTYKKATVKYCIATACLTLPFLALFVNQYYINDGIKNFKYKTIFDYPTQVWKQ
jgi:hypothetical protein